MLDYFFGGSNHYPFINQWHELTNFIHAYISRNNDVVYLFQISISALLILAVLFIVTYSISFILKMTMKYYRYVKKTSWNKELRSITNLFYDSSNSWTNLSIFHGKI